jgi:membrane associated rhomboid family serine protease
MQQARAWPRLRREAAGARLSCGFAGRDRCRTPFGPPLGTLRIVSLTESREARYAGFRLVLALAALMWVVEVLDVAAGHQLDEYGIEPRDMDGLPGIVAAPFLHAGFDHLVSNTLPFVLLGLAIALSGVARVAAVTAIVIVVGGLGTWLVAPEDTTHIGASGVVFGYATYLISRGLFNRSLSELAVGALVGLLWGGVLLGGLVPREGISWQGHLFGAIGGVVAAQLLARPRDAPNRAR